MKHFNGDIWTLHPEHFIVIPTNIGWTSTGENVMGRGLAKQATYKFPLLAKQYGLVCKEKKEQTRLTWFYDYKLILFPTKPLDINKPYYSWAGKSSLPLIFRGLGELSEATEQIVVPMLGCGNGKLKKEEVLPLIEHFLISDNFTLVNAS